MEQQEFKLFKKINNESELAYIIGLFEQENIQHYIANENMSTMLPISEYTKKIMVAEEDISRAKELFADEMLFENNEFSDNEKEYDFELLEQEIHVLRDFLNEVFSASEENVEMISFHETAEKILAQLSNEQMMRLTMQEVIALDTILIWAQETIQSNEILDSIEKSLNEFVESVREE